MAYQYQYPSLTLSNGLEMPILGLGTWKSKPGEVGEAVKAAIEAGYRHLDCAWLYQNEAEIGAALKEVFEQGKVKREDIFVTSKVWNTRHRYDDALTSLNETLTNLGLEYLDLFLIHAPMAYRHDGNHKILPSDAEGNTEYSDVSYLETWKALEKAHDDGLVKSIGLSNFNSKQVDDVIKNGRIKPVVNQIEIHPYFTQEKLVNFCKQRNIVVTAYSSFGSPDRPWANPDEPQLLDEPSLIEIGKKYNKSSAQVILRWLIQRDIIVIPKSVSPKRIADNFNVFDFILTDDDMKTVSGFDRNERLIVFYTMVDGKRVFKDRNAPNFPYHEEF